MKTLLALLVASESVFAGESVPPLSDRGESLRDHLGWVIPEQSTNVATTLPALPAGTNLLSGGIFVWRTDRFGTRPDVLPLELSMSETNYSANLVMFQDERTAMVDMLENAVRNTLPLSFLLDRHIALPNFEHGFIIRDFSEQGGNNASTFSSELHCLNGSIQVHLFASVPNTNIATVARAIYEFIDAGGVDIPEEPLRSSPSSSPPASEPFHAMRVFSSSPVEEPAPPAPESGPEPDGGTP